MQRYSRACETPLIYSVLQNRALGRIRMQIIVENWYNDWPKSIKVDLFDLDRDSLLSGNNAHLSDHHRDTETYQVYMQFLQYKGGVGGGGGRGVNDMLCFNWKLCSKVIRPPRILLMSIPRSLHDWRYHRKEALSPRYPLLWSAAALIIQTPTPRSATCSG